ncbi:MAG: hypothetical protein US62_C0017G0023 [Candidatus Woesebacteria bacterium GW2011_GWA1_37_8]|uniref:Uncharacterized protein n=2 Tax=Candidatus Woeseibacteriota TaxID=1752722 RepID=A0A0G0PCY1_9BACT|nr:MAG: hypothetical protein US39_C0015G0010 [Microgenomates group bacterium GW2011_GWC1_37_12b]KKQ45304.1 MAG: hypothetical protein US62_C0017G0023 [Candidatus Woesebacteria bacterium GW2011_GWA1_37_8]KKQ87106.1 MAG: hypothetical protein UT10_C0011G0037 [Candidatus Woesebacteria bacterium GW2011_GWB1_38_8b]
MSERAKAHPAYTTDWEDEIVNVLQIKPPTGLTHTDANMMCDSCAYHQSNPGPYCGGFQYGNGGNLNSAAISSEQPLRKKEWKILLTTAGCKAET